MSTYPEIAEGLCRAYARGEWDRFPQLCAQAAAKMTGERQRRVFEMLQKRAAPPRPPLEHWTRVLETRSPVTPSVVFEQLASWADEVRYAGALLDAGERVKPLLLVGPTRCGKTSTATALAGQLGLETVNRLGLAQCVGTHIGETSKLLRAALDEMTATALWLIDELDAVAFRRGAEDAAAQERAHAVGWLLTALDELPSDLVLVATTNVIENIDPAVVARFHVVKWPQWTALTPAEQDSFAMSHGCVVGDSVGSYEDAVSIGRRRRVAVLIERVKCEQEEHDGQATA